MNQLLQDDQEVLLPDTPPPPYPHDNSNKSLQARPTFWSPRQPPNRDWKTMAVRGKQFVHSLRCPPTVFSVAGTVQEAPPPAYETSYPLTDYITIHSTAPPAASSTLRKYDGSEATPLRLTTAPTMTMCKSQKRSQQSPIQPPTPLTSSSSSFTTNSTNPEYSLFDQSSSSWEWFGTNGNGSDFLRKHSVATDGEDVSSHRPVPMMDWRRGCSAPIMTMSLCCAYCSSPHAGSQSCGHAICETCAASLGASSCPLCCTQVSAEPFWDSDARIPVHHPFQGNQHHHPLLTPPPQYPCAKLTNIPWDVSQNDIRNFFGNCRSPNLATHAQSIHIMMDRTTGKTLSDAYVEFAGMADLRRAIETRHHKPLKGRIVTVSECSQEDLLRVVFPKWRGQFCGVSAIPPASEVVKSMSTAAGGGSSSGCPPFVTREEINSLLVVCKNYKLHFSRKCAERPFENIISVITKYPWHQAHLISTMHRDHIYEMLKLSIESLKTHLSKDYVQIDPTLLERLTRAGIMCPAFTERQKTMLLQTARLECPHDLIHYLLPVSTPAANANFCQPIRPINYYAFAPLPPQRYAKLEHLKTPRAHQQQFDGQDGLLAYFNDPTKTVLEQFNGLSLHDNDMFYSTPKSPSSTSSSLSLHDQILPV
ncbi:hypothetical protein BX666DRAFT_2024480 [Dichotomocladium elegans]|nr:hypothetical protein BX666DRAFT_2024480 [Dichotomocladium elegans]